MNTKLNAWALSQEEEAWIAKTATEPQGAGNIAFRMVPGLGPEVVAVTLSDGRVVTPSESPGWAAPQDPQPR